MVRQLPIRGFDRSKNSFQKLHLQKSKRNQVLPIKPVTLIDHNKTTVQSIDDYTGKKTVLHKTYLVDQSERPRLFAQNSYFLRPDLHSKAFSSYSETPNSLFLTNFYINFRRKKLSIKFVS